MIAVLEVFKIALTIDRPSVGELPPATAMIAMKISKTG